MAGENNTTKVETKSELEVLLEKNAYTEAGLTHDEFKRALTLIYENPVYAKEDCWVCKKSKAIYDTGLCRGHAFYALGARK
jgi:hypothetical protein